MSKKVTVTRKYIDDLKSKLQRLEEEKNRIEADRSKYRDFFVRLLKENVAMSSKNEYYSPATMINKLSKLMNDVQSWYWG